MVIAILLMHQTDRRMESIFVINKKCGPSKNSVDNFILKLKSWEYLKRKIKCRILVITGRLSTLNNGLLFEQFVA